MKYTNLVGKVYNCRGFDYFCSHWTPGDLSDDRGGGTQQIFTVVKHQICDTPGALFGKECVYETTGGNYFIYPVSELERTEQIKYVVYEIY